MESQSKQMLDSLTALQEEVSELRLENKHLRAVHSPQAHSPTRPKRQGREEHPNVDRDLWGQQQQGNEDTANELVVQHRKETQDMKRQLHEQNLLIEELEKKLADQTEQQTAKQAEFETQREELAQLRARIQEFRRTLDKKKKLAQAASPSALNVFALVAKSCVTPFS